MTRKVIYMVVPVLLLITVSTANATTALISPPKIPEQNLGASNGAKILRKKLNLQVIKDQRKRALVERIDTRITEVNKNQTLKFSEILTRLQGFLDKISKSTTDPNLLPNISAAQTSINTAKSTVESQALKVYTMTITDDVTLKQNAGAIVSQFRQELTAVHKLVMDAKQAVQNLYADKVLIKKEAATSSAGL